MESARPDSRPADPLRSSPFQGEDVVKRLAISRLLPLKGGGKEGVGLAMCVGASLLSACTADPFAARLETPRLGAAGWVAVEPIEPAAEIDAAYAAGVREAAAALDAKLDAACAEPRVATLADPERLAASDAALAEIAGGAPTLVRERVLVEACGETRLHAVYAAKDAAGAPVFLTGVPGGTIASLALQRDVVDQAVAQAAGVIASRFPEGACDAMASEPWALDTTLVAPPEEGRWSERWVVSACGQRKTIDVNFEETPTGARFSAPITLD